MIEINLATYDKQNEILSELKKGGGEGYFYLLASADSTAMSTDIEALKGLKNIKNIVNSEAAMRAIIGSSTAMEAVVNSSTAMEAVANSSAAMGAVANSSTAINALLSSKNSKHLIEDKIITGNFLPLKANNNSVYYQAYNGEWSNIGDKLGEWLSNNASNPIASQIKSERQGGIYYYDLDA